MRRCPNILTAIAIAVALVLNVLPVPAGADSITPSGTTTTVTGELTFPNGLPAADPTATSPQIVLPLVNPGSIVPPAPSADNATGNPMLINKSTSTGFDPTGVVDLLSKDNTQFGLSFFGTGIAPGGKLDFTLNVDSAFANTPIFANVSGITDSLGQPPPVTLPTPTPTPEPTPTPTPTTTPEPTAQTPAPQTPEPMSLLLWSTMGAGGLWYARRRKRKLALPA